jgi:hypothetical protein
MRRRDDNIKIYLTEICDDVDHIRLARDRVQCQVLVNLAMNLRDPYKAGIFLTK